MKVLIDNRWNGNTGIGRLFREVINNKPGLIDTAFVDQNFKLSDPMTPLYLHNSIKRSDADIFYSPSFMPPVFSNKPFVLTIHDLNHLYFYTKFHKFYLKHIIATLSKQAKRIITVSEFTKLEIVNKLKIRDDKIKVIYNGVDESFLLNQENYRCERPYFLYIGNRRKYKNIYRMLSAFAMADIPEDYILMLSGSIDPDIENMLHLLKIFDRVKFLNIISESELPKIYRGAFALLFVSLMEGFGLPVIEAMASGTPVITSNTTSLPEIAGDAAVFVNPYDISEIADSITSLVHDTCLYHKCVSLGYRRSKIFNWSNTVDKTWDCILN